MPYMAASGRDNLQGFTPRGAGGGRGPVARSSGPMAAVVQQDTPTVARRMATSTAVYSRDGVRRATMTGGNEITNDPFGTGGGIYNGPRRLVPARPGVALVRRSNVSLLGEYGPDAQYLGFSLGKVVKNIGNTVKKAVVDTGHVTGKVVTSKVGQGILGTALAVSGVGAPAAAGIFAATKGIGTAIKPGGNLKGALTGAAQGAVEGLASAAAGKVARAAISKVKTSHASTGAAASAAGAVTAAGVVAAPSILPPGLDISNLPGIQVTPIGPGDMAPPFLPVLRAADLPQYPKQKRVRALPASDTGRIGVAKKVLKAGQDAKKGADETAGRLDALTSKLDAVTGALDAAKQIGDKTGMDQLSQLAEQLKGQVQNAQNVAGGASADIRAVGNAAEGATGGAVAGAGLSGLSDFIQNNKVAVYGSLAGVGVLIALALTMPKKGNGGGNAYRRARARR